VIDDSSVDDPDMAQYTGRFIFYIIITALLHRIQCLCLQSQQYFALFDYNIVMIPQIKFGRFLLERGLIKEIDILNARFLQRKTNLRIGEIAMKKGWLNEDDIRKILVIQEETQESFGEIAVRERYLSEEQRQELLKEQEDTYLHFGEALVKIGAISEEKLLENLKEFNKLRLKASDSY